MTEKDTFLIFLYGTLMSDGCRNNAVRNEKFIRGAKTKPKYTLFDLGGFPGLTYDEKAGREVEGELWEVSKSLLPTLDRIECAPQMYRMEEVEIEGEELPVYAYFFLRGTTTTPIYAETRWDNRR